MACDAHGKGCIWGIHVFCMLGHGHINLIKVHCHRHVHGVWFTMWAEHDLIPGLWELCITLVLVTPCILYAHCMVTGYVLEVREDRPEGAYGSVVLWLGCREH